MTDSQEEKEYTKKSVNTYMIANAIVWGGVIVATALVLRGTGYMDELIPILGGGAGASIVILGPGLLRKK